EERDGGQARQRRQCGEAIQPYVKAAHANDQEDAQQATPATPPDPSGAPPRDPRRWRGLLLDRRLGCLLHRLLDIALGLPLPILEDGSKLGVRRRRLWRLRLWSLRFGRLRLWSLRLWRLRLWFGLLGLGPKRPLGDRIVGPVVLPCYKRALLAPWSERFFGQELVKRQHRRGPGL